jgi:hypothetical protein
MWPEWHEVGKEGVKEEKQKKRVTERQEERKIEKGKCRIISNKKRKK